VGFEREPGGQQEAIVKPKLPPKMVQQSEERMQDLMCEARRAFKSGSPWDWMAGLIECLFGSRRADHIAAISDLFAMAIEKAILETGFKFHPEPLLAFKESSHRDPRVSRISNLLRASGKEWKATWMKLSKAMAATCTDRKPS
jgi:hypothetical protein